MVQYLTVMSTVKNYFMSQFSSVILCAYGITEEGDTILNFGVNIMPAVIGTICTYALFIYLVYKIDSASSSVAKIKNILEELQEKIENNYKINIKLLEKTSELYCINKEIHSEIELLKEKVEDYITEEECYSALEE